MTDLTEEQRRSILDKLGHTVATRFYDPHMNGVEWPTVLAERYEAIVRAPSPAEFEHQVNALLKQLGTSHVGFFHESVPRASGRAALCATFLKAETSHGLRWVFQDVHAGGPAQWAGIEPGDVLLRSNTVEVHPPEPPAFAMGGSSSLDLLRRDGSTATLSVSVPEPKSRKQPLVLPDLVLASRLENDTGWLKVTMFPGVVGIDVANQISRAVAELACDRLIIDLRGNTGGGMGCLRLMSYLCPQQEPVGYSLTRRRAEQGVAPEQLPRFDRIPASKWGLVPLLVKFARGDRSIAIVTEGLGSQRFQGRVVLLLNEHSASACEMVAAFCEEHGLATLVGTQTPGRLVGANSFKVGQGYRVALPVVAYRTWQGQQLEGVGVTPTLACPASYEALRVGTDEPLAAACRLLS